ncbi:MAG: DUF1501 domain-containing protein [Acidobacteria bacterium]|nr:MAG: DUF1501 domain-containing protein [Acidobacteriota bacterium]REK02258.1 MAG: DUF1501 domain-containing protein [Acidobacteriota bacterium]REK13939.1 MAG: DUF1501 domain-containing protein [Acidobacteriota bacterium]REK41933.1 MAG: DUF1501 domain-containing protein [Acidobacteriota bacterium]
MKKSRRRFIKQAGCALGMATLATQVHHFGLINALAQKVDDRRRKSGSLGTGYKALVCVFLGGGNDGNNMIVPNHNSGSISNYSVYSAARSPQGLAIPQGQLLPISVPRMGGLSYGLHPSMGPVVGGNNGLHELWGQGKLAFATNIGTLVSPMTKAQYQNNSVSKPYQLFSHLDQVYQFQAGRSDTFSFTGWGGRVSDEMTSGSNPNGLVPMITSIDGSQLFTSGQSTQALAIADSNTPLNEVLNPIGFEDDPISQARLQAFNEIRAIDRENNYVEAASAITDSALEANDALASYQEVTVTFPNTAIGRQLKQVARIIKKQPDLNVDRQIFYVERGGFDTHNNQVGGQANNLGEVSQAVRAFYDEMVVQGRSSDVTTFMMTDFGRTMNPAGAGGSVGSDHGWSNHLFVLGDAVDGGDFYGINTSNGTPFPNLTIDGPDDATNNSANARGRWIPTASVEQYAATLARWYGLEEQDLPVVFPNIGSFSSTDLGFML